VAQITATKHLEMCPVKHKRHCWSTWA